MFEDLLTKTVSKQVHAALIGLTITIFHALLQFLIYFVFDLSVSPGNERVIVKDLSIPVTMGYVTTFVMYLIKNNGIVRTDERAGISIIIVSWLFTIGFCCALIGLPLLFHLDSDMTPEQLNNGFLAVEAAFGVGLGLMVNYLFGSNESNPNPKLR